MFRYALVFLVLPLKVFGLTLDMPSNAVLVGTPSSEVRSYALPIGPWTKASFPTQAVEGVVTTRIYQLPADSITPLQLLLPLKSQLQDNGWEILLDCTEEECGGYDFRFATEVKSAPDMQVALGNYRFLSARNAEEVVSLFVSRTSRAGFIQLIHVSKDTELSIENDAPATKAITNTSSSDESFAEVLEQEGHLVLSDLNFETGSAQLGTERYSSLEDIAGYLSAHPSRRIALVGHTDSSGSLEANIALSKRRAGSVLERLVTDYGAKRSQLDAEGMGYLSPISTNLTIEGRDANRRVEAVLISVE